MIIWNDLDQNIWLLGSAALGGVSVNIFGIITGFVSYTEEERPFKPQKYLKTWAVVLFYSVGITAAVWLIDPASVSSRMMLMSLFPTTTATWWYFSSWTAVLFLSPLLLTMARHWNIEWKYVGVLVVVFSIYTTVVGVYFDPFNLFWGFSTLWLCIMFVVGALLKKHVVATKIKNSRLLAVLGGSLLVLLIGAPLAGILSNAVVGRTIAAKIITDYTSPVVITCSLSMFLLFVKLETSGRFGQLISFLGPASFGIYIIHCHPAIKELIKEKMTWILGRNLVETISLILAVSLVIWALCLMAECIRRVVAREFFAIFTKNKVGKQNNEFIQK